MSVHRADSELARLNSLAANEPVKVSPELFHVLNAAREIAEQTEGSFDFTIRPLAELWGFIWKEYRLPTRAELDRVLPLVGFRTVELDRHNRTVRFLRQGTSIELNAIAKGYAVDRAIEKLKELGIGSAMVKAGGDLRVMGAPPGRSSWTVQIEDPRKRGQRQEISLRDAALSTSGNYENFFVVDGTRYAHIIDPRTGLPVQGVAACTVVAPTCVESDALATALFVYGVEKSFERFGERFPVQFTLAPGGGEGEVIIRQNRLFARLLK